MPAHPLHATCLALRARNRKWGAILFRGSPGSGKSDLALRLLTRLTPENARLVADDYVDLRKVEGTLIASAPATIAGLLEVRGLGVVEVETVPQAPVVLAFDLSEAALSVRLPLPSWLDLKDLTAGLQIPVYKINPFHASAEAKVMMAHGTVSGQNRLVSPDGQTGPRTTR